VSDPNAEGPRRPRWLRLFDSGRSRLVEMRRSRWFELGAWALVSIAVALLLTVISAQVLPPNY
jgi:hypothetical protein